MTQVNYIRTRLKPVTFIVLEEAILDLLTLWDLQLDFNFKVTALIFNKIQLAD
jgi:hypothetical protein